MKREPRYLRQDELALWRKVRLSATPLPRSGKSLSEGETGGSLGENPISGMPLASGKPTGKGSGAFSGRMRPEAKPGPRMKAASAQPSGLQARDVDGILDRKKARRLRQGRMKPEARLDLHGMNVARARPALERFILDAHARGHRLVLVITGKGRAAPEIPFASGPGGVLRRSVPAWLNAPPLSHCVLGVREAHARHGGAGACYVILRKAR